jgi:hypothetical protein
MARWLGSFLLREASCRELWKRLYSTGWLNRYCLGGVGYTVAQQLFIEKSQLHDGTADVYGEELFIEWLSRFLVRLESQ